MYLLPEIEKLQKEIDELKVKLEDKKSIVQTTRGDLMRLHNQNLELGLAVNTKQQKLDHEVEVSWALHIKKENLD